ncbi:hypothetical protein [Streptomyces griseosporeus]|uniref:hypothetical protein n=1 Tax=Streptomyces griseosporeus TaxID=1910 RepID=UPI00167DDA16|nr:hypothetical protein [Streptomyces griseosporeus]
MAAITSFEEALKASGLPKEALAPIQSAWDNAFKLIVENNKRIAQVNASKANDPNNTEYLDSLWKSAQANGDEEIAPLADKFDAVSAEYERLIAELREKAKAHVPAQLSEDETKSMRALVNQSADAIDTARKQALALVTIIDSMLEVKGMAIEGGVASLLPQADSLKNTRGRKGATGEKSYSTRITGFDFNGNKVANDEGKVNFRFAANKVSEEIGATTYPENRITGDEIEAAFFKALGKEFRSVKSTEIPARTDFDFEKAVKVSDDKTETRVLKFTVYGPQPETNNTNNAPAEKPAEEKKNDAPANAEAAPVVTKPAAKIDTRTEAQKKAEAAKK